MARSELRTAGRRTVRKAAIGGALAAALALAGCGGGGHANSGKQTGGGPGSSGRHIELALAAGGSVQADLPGKPLGSVHTSVAGLDLELWSLQRENKAVNVIVALHNTGSADVDSYLQVTQALDEEGSQATNQLNNLGLLDTDALKEYKVFANVSDTGNVTDCLCSITSIVKIKAGTRHFYAAVVAAPPAQKVTFVSGVGSIPNVSING